MICRLWLLCAALPFLLAGQDSSIREFHISVGDDVLADLQERLERTRIPHQIPGTGWDYGSDTAYLEELLDYWRDEYDWRKHEETLNRLPHFKTEIDGLDLHFVHIRSKEPNALPLVITHGWPGSFYEFMDVIGPLTDPVAHGGRAEDAFHLVLPSMPGYGFSGKPAERGYGPKRIAETIAKLMARLGYSRYAAQGGDWGFAVSVWLGALDAQHVAGVHVNFVPRLSLQGMEDPEDGIPEWELKRWRERSAWWEGENAYSAIQGTKPLTLAYGLNDSPAGLAAWIVEKFAAWSDSNGDIESRFTKDELLTNIMLYWTTETMPSAVRIYCEWRGLGRPMPRGSETPTAVAVFPHELYFSPRKWVEAHFNVQQWTEMPRGGHFAAMEEPELLVEDISKFFRRYR